MNRKNFTRCFSILLLGGACLAASLLIDISAKAEDTSGNVISIKGTCEFMRQQGTWSAELTPTDTPDVYDAQYVASFSMGGRAGGDHMTYVGQIKSDFKTTISGNGKSTGGGGNGTFEFSGNYGDDGIAQCNYTEVGGQRSGTLTAEKPE
ncbi:MAG: hypothetical protein P8Y80_12415 [Acidobacteriota bacterium]|jgi:hypothetical protein